MKSKTKSEKLHMSKVADLGCIICGDIPELHHITTHKGMGLRASHFDVIGLCPAHHRTGGHGTALHAGVKTWEKNFGTQLELLEKVKTIIASDEALLDCMTHTTRHDKIKDAEDVEKFIRLLKRLGKEIKGAKK